MSVAIVIEHAKLMSRTILSSVACPAVPVFSHYLINGTMFGDINYYTQNVYSGFLYNFCRKISYYKKNSARHCN